MAFRELMFITSNPFVRIIPLTTKAKVNPTTATATTAKGPTDMANMYVHLWRIRLEDLQHSFALNCRWLGYTSISGIILWVWSCAFWPKVLSCCNISTIIIIEDLYLVEAFPPDIYLSSQTLRWVVRIVRIGGWRFPINSRDFCQTRNIARSKFVQVLFPTELWSFHTIPPTPNLG